MGPDDERSVVLAAWNWIRLTVYSTFPSFILIALLRAHFLRLAIEAEARGTIGWVYQGGARTGLMKEIGYVFHPTDEFRDFKRPPTLKRRLPRFLPFLIGSVLFSWI